MAGAPVFADLSDPLWAEISIECKPVTGVAKPGTIDIRILFQDEFGCFAASIHRVALAPKAELVALTTGWCDHFIAHARWPQSFYDTRQPRWDETA